MWREAGRERVCWVDPSGKLVVRWRPIVSEFEDIEEPPDPLDLLTAKQRFVIELRYGLRDESVYTQREVAALMGITQKAVDKLERRAIRRLERVLRRGTHTAINREES